MPEITISSVKESIVLWFNSVLPVLLPFFIISRCIYYSGGMIYFTKILSPLLKIFGLDKNACFPFAMTLLCGYQTGSKTVALMEKDGLKNIDYFANICYSSSPLFVIGTVGTSILNSTHEGYMLYLIHMLTLIIFICFNKSNEETDEIPLSIPSGNLATAIKESIMAIFSVCCYMILFGIIIKILTSNSFIPQKISVIISGILEFTSGIKKACNSFDYALPFISFFLSFGGLCVITQCISNYKKINVKRFILNRLLSGIIAFVLCFLYKKTAIYVPIIITAIIILISNIIRRKKYYLLKSSKSCVT